MFNQGKYNLSSYNIKETTASPLIANSRMILRSIKTPYNLYKHCKANTNMAMRSSANGSVLKSSGKTMAGMQMASLATKHILEKYAINTTAMMRMISTADHALSGEEYIELVDHQGRPLVLEPLDELLIDTCNMTVTINGINGMKYFSDNSRFFLLNQGINDIIYTDTSEERIVEIDVLWKDRWL